MRILFLSNFYPPHAIGGMEIICQSVVNGLSQQGHQCQVLTSRHGLDQPSIDGDIARQLHLEMKLTPLTNAYMFFFDRNKRCLENRAILRSWVDAFTPDIIFVWGMWNLPKILARDAEEMMNGKVLYQFADYWPALPSQYQHYWDRPGKSLPTRIIRRLLRPVAKLLLQKDSEIKLDIPHSYCVSQAVKNHLIAAGLPVHDAAVIPNGLDLTNFYHNLELEFAPELKLHKLLFVGRIQEIKGLHVALDALNLLRKELPKFDWKLTVIGAADPEYMTKVQRRIETSDLAPVVDFMGVLPYAQIPIRMRENGILLVPSIWDEPFGLVAIEGMAAGCLVIGSDIGGLKEVIEPGNTGYLFPPGDSRQLADTISYSITHPQETNEIIRRAQETAIQRYSVAKMLERIQQLLLQVINLPSHPSPVGR